MSLAALFITMTWAGVKLASATLPMFEIIFFRALFSFLMLAVMVKQEGRSFQPVQQRKLLFVRSIAGALAMILVFFALKYISIGNATALFNTMPIFAALLAPVLVGEVFYRKNFLFILMAFVGICLILKPDGGLFDNAAFLSLGGGFFMAVAEVWLRRLHKSEATSVIAFYMAGALTIMVVIPCLQQFQMPTIMEWLILIGIAVSVTIAQIFGTKAYAFAEAAIIAPFVYITVILSYIVGVVVFDEIPDCLSLIGAVVITLSGVLIIRERTRARSIPPP